MRACVKYACVNKKLDRDMGRISLFFLVQCELGSLSIEKKLATNLYEGRWLLKWVDQRPFMTTRFVIMRIRTA